MKPSVSEAINLRLAILKANTAFNLKEALAYSLNNWGGLASTITYMVTYLVFLSALFSRIPTIAGYRYPEMLLFTLVIQMNFYLTWSLSLSSIERVGQDIKSGKLDLILSKPLPALWYLTFQKINVSMLVFEMWPATLPLLYLLFKHADFAIYPINILGAFVIFLLGLITVHCFQFIFTTFAFWTGESKSLINFSTQTAFFGDTIPLEAYPKSVIFLGLTAIPFLAHTALSTSYLLGKTTGLGWIILVLITASTFLFVKIKFWQYALKHYTSASS